MYVSAVPVREFDVKSRPRLKHSSQRSFQPFHAGAIPGLEGLDGRPRLQKKAFETPSIE